MSQQKRAGSASSATTNGGQPQIMKMVGAVLLVLAAIVGFVYAGKLEGFWLQPSLESLQPSAERLAKMKPSADDLARWQAQHPGEPLIPYGVKLKPGQTRPPLHGGDD